MKEKAHDIYSSSCNFKIHYNNVESQVCEIYYSLSKSDFKYYACIIYYHIIQVSIQVIFYSQLNLIFIRKFQPSKVHLLKIMENDVKKV